MGENTDNRKYPRVDTCIPVRYRKLGDPKEKLSEGTISKNLSEGGVRFKTAEFISRACRLILEVDIPMISKPVRAIAKVAWIRKMPSEKDFEIGNQFLEITRNDKELVAEYVDSLKLYNGNDLREEALRFAENVEADSVDL
ncbi:MAG: PilZ domain-containing protein [Candidatus Omnitrophota bacterium]